MTYQKPTDLMQYARERERQMAIAEQRLEDAAGEAMQTLLRLMRGAARETLTAAAGKPPRMAAAMFTQGRLDSWWQRALDEEVMSAVRQTWQDGRTAASDADLSVGSLDAAGDYMARVRDRLSRTAQPTIPEQAFDQVRTAITDEMSRGSSSAEMGRRIAAELQWTGEDRPFWDGRAKQAEQRVEQMLEAVGPKFVTDAQGRRVENPERKAMRLNDPEIRSLQKDMADARKHLDRDESVWQQRSERIARTESTGAYNAGQQSAFFDEEVGAKMWIALADDRTRDSHLEAHGQCVPAAEEFVVGGETIMMPGSPSGSSYEVINCRCTMVAGDSCAELQGLAAQAGGPIEAERSRRDLPDPSEAPTALATESGPEQISDLAAMHEADASSRLGLTDFGDTDLILPNGDRYPDLTEDRLDAQDLRSFYDNPGLANFQGDDSDPLQDHKEMAASFTRLHDPDRMPENVNEAAAHWSYVGNENVQSTLRAGEVAPLGDKAWAQAAIDHQARFNEPMTPERAREIYQERANAAIPLLDEGIAGSTEHGGFVGYRGLQSEMLREHVGEEFYLAIHDGDNERLRGLRFEDPAFTAVSLDQGTGMEFAAQGHSMKDTIGPTVLMEIEVPNGVGALSINETSAGTAMFEAEHEMLLGRNSKLEVVSVTSPYNAETFDMLDSTGALDTHAAQTGDELREMHDNGMLPIILRLRVVVE